MITKKKMMETEEDLIIPSSDDNSDVGNEECDGDELVDDRRSLRHATMSMSLTSESLSSWPRWLLGEPSRWLASIGSMQWLMSTLC